MKYRQFNASGSTFNNVAQTTFFSTNVGQSTASMISLAAIPTDSVGLQLMQTTITPLYTASKFEIDVSIPCISNDIEGGVAVALFTSMSANSICTAAQYGHASTAEADVSSASPCFFRVRVDNNGSLAAKTVQVRFGAISSGTAYANKFFASTAGSSFIASITIRELI